MFSGWMFILALNLAMAGFKALYDFPQWEDWVWFSGESLEAGRWFVALTATLDHAGYPHLVNNMAMMLLTASEVEGLVGPFGFVVIYFVTGAAGWLLTLALTRYR
jgi:membrane associated rhomboid family serine protease